MVYNFPVESPLTPETTGAPESNITSAQLKSVEPLPAVLGVGDLTVLMVLIVLFVANNNGVQLAGPSAFFSSGLVLLTFFSPAASIPPAFPSPFPPQGPPPPAPPNPRH